MKTAESIITLIHVTFARGAEWVKADSAFARQLDDNLSTDVTFTSFASSGENSHSSRLLAGQQLANQLNKQFRVFQIIFILLLLTVMVGTLRYLRRTIGKSGAGLRVSSHWELPSLVASRVHWINSWRSSSIS
jgi:hypothetical protein